MNLFLMAIFLINCQPQITDSLLAINIFLLIFNNSKVGFKPAIPGIAAIEMSDFL